MQTLLKFMLLAVSVHQVVPRMALETQEDYLNHLYLQVKDRPQRNGELNLLPDGNLPGFANTVRCVPENEKASDITDVSRKMHFKGVTVKSSESLIAVNLVIDLPTGFSQDGEVTLYKVSSDGYQKQLDNASVPSCQSTCWFELTVGVSNLQDSMELLVEFTHRNDEFVREINPMMALYTYMEQPLAEIVDKRHAPDSVRFHEQPEPHSDTQSGPDNEEEEHVNVQLDDIDSSGEACTKRTVRLGYSQMRWLGVGEHIVLINPSHITFEFCYGHCNIPLVTVPYSDVDNTFDKRTRILEVANHLSSSESRLNPPPNCIPLSYSANEVIYAVGDLVAMTTFPSVEECGCRL